MRRLSGSKLERAAECPASTALPVIQSTPGQAAHKGTVVHKYLQLIAEGKTPEQAFPADLEERKWCEVIDLSRLPLTGKLYAEIGVAFNPRTGGARVMGVGMEHGQGDASELEISGIADLAEDIPETDTVMVLDYKTGRGHVPPAVRNRQLAFLALCLTKVWKRSRAIVALVHIRGDSEPYFDLHELTAFELAGAELDLKKTFDRAEQAQVQMAAGKPLEYKTGDHCDYCESFDYCEAKTKLIRQFATGEGGLEAKVQFALTAGEAADAYQHYREVAQVMKRIEGALRNYAKNTPIPCGDGRVYGEKASLEDVIIGEKAKETLIRLVGDDAVRFAKTVVTKDSVEDAARALVEKRKAAGIKATIKATKEELLNAMYSDSAMVQEVRVKMCEHKPDIRACCEPQARGVDVSVEALHLLEVNPVSPALSTGWKPEPEALPCPACGSREGPVGPGHSQGWCEQVQDMARAGGKPE